MKHWIKVRCERSPTPFSHGFPMFFASDNWAGAHQSIAERLLAESTGFATAYGNSDLDRKVEARFQRGLRARRFHLLRRHRHGCQFAVACKRPAPRRHHLLPFGSPCDRDECGAPEFFAGASGWSLSPAKPARSTRQSSRQKSPASPRGRRAPRPRHGGDHHPGKPRSAPSIRCPRSARSRLLQRSAACRCTWTAPVSPMRWWRSVPHRRK